MMISFSTPATTTRRWGPDLELTLAGPCLASLLGKTGAGAKTHRCQVDFFFWVAFLRDNYQICRGFKNIHVGLCAVHLNKEFRSNLDYSQSGKG
jgi:hypothetical protein